MSGINNGLSQNINTVSGKLDEYINATPTGDLRNTLSEAQILLLHLQKLTFSGVHAMDISAAQSSRFSFCEYAKQNVSSLNLSLVSTYISHVVPNAEPRICVASLTKFINEIGLKQSKEKISFMSSIKIYEVSNMRDSVLCRVEWWEPNKVIPTKVVVVNRLQ